MKWAYLIASTSVHMSPTYIYYTLSAGVGDQAASLCSVAHAAARVRNAVLTTRAAGDDPEFQSNVMHPR